MNVEMTADKSRALVDRVARAAEAALASDRSVSPVEVFMTIGWLDVTHMKRWRQGQEEDLESCMQVNETRLSEAMDLLQSWAAERGLIASEMPYVAQTPRRQALRFSRSGDPERERRYRTHWLSAELSDSQRARLIEKASRPPELVVVQSRHAEWTCHRCGSTGGLLMMENPGPACLDCVGLGDLEFLGPGDALLTRRAKAKSARHAVVVKFSRARRRYERQGLLVEPQALAEAQREVAERKR
jgi:hypothetical protein